MECGICTVVNGAMNNVKLEPGTTEWNQKLYKDYTWSSKDEFSVRWLEQPDSYQSRHLKVL